MDSRATVEGASQTLCEAWVNGENRVLGVISQDASPVVWKLSHVLH